MSQLAARLAVAGAAFALATIAALLARRRRPAAHRGQAATGLPIWLVASLGAALAASLPATPVVGIDVVDRAARALAVLLLVAVSENASPRALVVGIGVLAVGSPGTVPGVGAAVAGGAALGWMISRRAWPGWLRAIAVVTLAVLATRHVRGSGLEPVLVGALALAIVVVAGTHARRPSLKTIGAVAVVVGGLGLLSGVAALRARPAFDTGISAAQAALSDAKAGRIAEAEAELATARRALSTGRDRLRAWWGRPGWFIPVVGVDLRDVDQVAAAGAQLVTAGASLLAAARLENQQVGAGGRVSVDQLTGFIAPLDEANASLIRAARTIRRSRSRWLPGAIRTKITGFEHQIEDAQHTTTFAGLADRLGVALLGHNGAARHYLLVLTSAGELRGAAGVIANYGVLTADDGSISLTKFGRTFDLAAAAPSSPDGIGLDPTFAAVYHDALQGSLWQNITISPDFPTSADAMAKLYPSSGGEPVDGVVSIDAEGIAALLSVEGAVTVPDWPTPITAQSVAGILEHDEYNAFAGNEDRRTQFLAALTTAIVSRLRTSEGSSLTGVLSAFSAAVAGKHLMIASTVPEEEQVINQLGIGGALAPVADDTLSVLTTNGGANKIDWYLRRSVNYAVTVDPHTGALHAQLRLQLTNTAPASGESDLLIGSMAVPPPPKGTNRVIASVLTPWSLADAAVDGTAVPVARNRELGRAVYGLELDIPAGATRTVVFDLNGTSHGPYSLTVTQQPTVVPDHLDVGVSIGATTRRWTAEVKKDLVFVP